ncbi:MAG: hypothetical protein EZS28_014637 [Streblomastix strix]|uniref:Uncharacterized protein n=1 Tax=Streblomastix strix TaxID=222440 RepID=A0A5J4W4Q2_9EUKA|nr:MAG: hypothetical protein EZS28_014637 [Streblomastix strix]
MDEFATRINRQHRKFCSVTKIIWANARDVLWKVKQDLVQTAVSIAPKWSGQFWYIEHLTITVQMIRLDYCEQVLILGQMVKKKQWYLQQGEIYMFKVSCSQLRSCSGSCQKIMVQSKQQSKEQQNHDIDNGDDMSQHQSSMFMANFLPDRMENGVSNKELKSYKGTLVVLLSFIGYKEEQVHRKPVAQLMNPVQI